MILVLIIEILIAKSAVHIAEKAAALSDGRWSVRDAATHATINVTNTKTIDINQAYVSSRFGFRIKQHNYLFKISVTSTKKKEKDMSWNHIGMHIEKLKIAVRRRR